jgi:hypothetical protein
MVRISRRNGRLPVAEQRADGEIGVIEISGDGCEGMPQRVRGDFRGQAGCLRDAAPSLGEGAHRLVGASRPAKLAKHPKFKAWSRESGTEGMLLIREDVLKAAAEVPLYDHQGNGSYFDPDEFFTHVLAVAEEDGRA